MKILVWGANPESPTGLGWVTLCMSNALTELGHAVNVLTYQGGSTRKVPTMEFSQIQFAGLLKICEEYQYDLIITIGDIWNCYPIYQMVLKRPIPWVAYLGSEGSTYPRVAHFDNQNVYDIHEMMNYIAGYWCYSQLTLDVVKKTTLNIINSRIISHCVDIAHIEKCPKWDKNLLKQQLKIPTEKKIALFVGDNIRRKGIDLFVEIVARDKNWHGIIHTPLHKELGFDLREMISRYPNQFTLTFDTEIFGKGFFQKNDVIGLMKACDLFLHPHRAEGFGLCVLEAYIANCRVIATRYGGPKDILNDKGFTGFKRYDQFGGIGYEIMEPIITDPIDRYYIETDTLSQCSTEERYRVKTEYSIERFKENIRSALEHEYRPVLKGAVR